MYLFYLNQTIELCIRFDNCLEYIFITEWKRPKIDVVLYFYQSDNVFYWVVGANRDSLSNQTI